MVDLKDEKVDHINRNPLDNRKSNLRLVSNSKNNLNKKVSSMFGLKGIYWTGINKKWKVYIKRNNIIVSNINFENVIDAIDYKIKNSLNYDDVCIWKEELNIYEKELKEVI